MTKETTVTIQKTSKGIKLQKYIGGALVVVGLLLVLGRESPEPWAVYTGVPAFVIGAGLYTRAAWAKWWHHE